MLEALNDKFGYDFSEYSTSHISRRLVDWLDRNGLNSAESAIFQINANPKVAYSLIQQFSICVTEMFRNPKFFQSLVSEVIPKLKTYPFIKVWHAGCATGEEVYSMAILLKEAGLYDHCRIYATDINEELLDIAKKGIYSADLFKEYSNNYRETTGKNTLTNYFTSAYDSVIIDEDLKKNIVWANHNLTTDSVFNEMHLIVCRNVVIYFNNQLHDRVLRLFNDSLITGGFLCLGIKESLRFSAVESCFETVNGSTRIYKKVT